MADQSITGMVNDYQNQRGQSQASPAYDWGSQPSRQQVDQMMQQAIQGSPLYQKLDDQRQQLVNKAMGLIMQTPVLDAEVQALKQNGSSVPGLPKDATLGDYAKWFPQALSASLQDVMKQQQSAADYLGKNLPSYVGPSNERPPQQSFGDIQGVPAWLAPIADLAVSGAAAAGTPEIAGLPGVALGAAKRLPQAAEGAVDTMKTYNALSKAKNYAEDVRRELGSIPGLEHLSEQEFTALTKMVTRMGKRPVGVVDFLQRMGASEPEAQKAAQKIAKALPEGVGNGNLMDALSAYDSHAAQQQATAGANKLFSGMSDEEANQVFHQIANEGKAVEAMDAGRMTTPLEQNIIPSDFHQIINEVANGKGSGVSEFDANAIDAAYRSLMAGAGGKGTFTADQFAREAFSLGAGKDAVSKVLAQYLGMPVYGAADAMKDIVMPQRLASGERLMQQALPADRFQPSLADAIGQYGSANLAPYLKGFPHTAARAKGLKDLEGYLGDLAAKNPGAYQQWFYDLNKGAELGHLTPGYARQALAQAARDAGVGLPTTDVYDQIGTLLNGPGKR